MAGYYMKFQYEASVYDSIVNFAQKLSIPDFYNIQSVLYKPKKFVKT